MPRLMDDDKIETIKNSFTGSYNFSGVRPDRLDNSEYTLVTIVVDITGSVSSFAVELLNTVKAIVEACKKSPKSDNLMIRLVTFNNSVYEEHGFKLLSMIKASDYKPFSPTGMTALHEATYESISSVLTYSQTLIAKDFSINGAIYIITDGENNLSGPTPAEIKKLLKNATKKEVIESLITVLVGINAADCKVALDRFVKDAGLSQFVDVGDATPQRLAKLAGWVSKSISSQSQALGSGTASQPLKF